MTQVSRWLIRSAIVLAAMMLVSCVTIAHYIPDQNSVKTMSVREARNIVEKSLQRGNVYQRGFNASISGTRITPSGITILTKKGQSVVIPFKDVNIVAYDSEMRGFDGIYNDIVIDDTLESRIILKIPNQNINDIASALFVLTRSGPRLRAMEDIDLHFDATARAYRDASPKPVLPENPYTLIGILEGREKKAVLREYTGNLSVLTQGKKLIDEAIITRIDSRSIKVKKDGKERELTENP